MNTQCFDSATMEQLRGRAQFFIDCGHHERALMMLDMLAALDNSDPTVALLAVDSLLALGRSTEAEARVRDLLAHDPEYPEALVALAEVQIAAGELVPAAATLGRVLEGDPECQTTAGQRAAAVAAAACARIAEAGRVTSA